MVWLQQLFTKSNVREKSQSYDYKRDWIQLNGDLSDRVKIFFSPDREIDVYELEELCDSVGWARRPIRKVKRALDNSYLIVSAYEVRGNKPFLIGFGRATSDHAFNATLWDIVIHPRFQKKGLGKTQ